MLHIKQSVCDTSQFAGSSGPLPYTLRVFNGGKWVFRLSLSLPRKIVLIAFMHCDCKTVGAGINDGQTMDNSWINTSSREFTVSSIGCAYHAELILGR